VSELGVTLTDAVTRALLRLLRRWALWQSRQLQAHPAGIWRVIAVSAGWLVDRGLRPEDYTQG